MRHLLPVVLPMALCLSAPAFAGPVLDAHLTTATPTSSASEADVKLGTGLGARVGLPLDLGIARLVPEAGLTAWNGQGLLVPELGARASIGAGIEPGAYGHLLFPMPTPGGPTRGWDAGGSLAFTMLPVDIGVRAGLLGLSGPAMEPTTYLTAGIDVGFSF